MLVCASGGDGCDGVGQLNEATKYLCFVGGKSI